MYGLQDWAAVQRVYKQTHSKRETAKILKISRNTVKKLLELKEEPTYKRTVYKSCLDEYSEATRTYRLPNPTTPEDLECRWSKVLNFGDKVLLAGYYYNGKNKPCYFGAVYHGNL